jgi:hypothetical protein
MVSLQDRSLMVSPILPCPAGKGFENQQQGRLTAGVVVKVKIGQYPRRSLEALDKIILCRDDGNPGFRYPV